MLITEQGNENLSEALPRNPDDVESWIQGIWNRDENVGPSAGPAA